MKKTPLCSILLAVVLTIFIAGCTQQQPVTPAPTATPALTTAATTVPTATQTTSPAGQATLIVAIRDAPKTTGIGTITHLWLDISEVSVHRVAANETVIDTDDEISAEESADTGTAGWTVVVSQATRVDLMELIGVSADIGQAMADPGRYTQIRLKIDSGTITVDNTTYNLTVPGGVLKLNRGFVLEPGKTLRLTLDFNVEKSVIRTGSGKYSLKPVIAVLSETVSGISEEEQEQEQEQAQEQEREQACVQSGGNVTTRLCCGSADDFPNLCLIGPCGCAPASSHQIRVCDCGSGKCFNGTACAAV
jgi:Domain of unknown function (DUF4382)